MEKLFVALLCKRIFWTMFTCGREKEEQMKFYYISLGGIVNFILLLQLSPTHKMVMNGLCEYCINYQENFI